jgi:hypothetical protein
VVLTILKNMKVNGKDDIPYIMEKKKFETTNHIYDYVSKNALRDGQVQLITMLGSDFIFLSWGLPYKWINGMNL